MFGQKLIKLAKSPIERREEKFASGLKMNLLTKSVLKYEIIKRLTPNMRREMWAKKSHMPELKFKYDFDTYKELTLYSEGDESVK